ncbi:MAG: phage tail sheath protein FI [Paracoccaceae bacterium]|jgi:phage tail sheath protein FI
MYGEHSNYLNANRVNTVINTGDGYVTWGNRGATGDDL